MNFKLKYGKSTLEFQVPDKNLLGVLKGRLEAGGELPDEKLLISNALDAPIVSRPLEELAAGARTAAVMVSDITRPAPTKRFIGQILDRIEAGGIARENITILFGMGVHRRHTPEEQRALVGNEVFESCRLLDSSEDAFVMLGTSSRGTPIHVARTYAEADLKVCTGNIEYHYFAGYSGGAKAVMPGASNYDSIRANHALQLDPGSKAGAIEGNPVRLDIDEIGGIAGVDFLFNVVLDEQKRIRGAFAGDFIEAHRAGCRLLDRFYSVPIEEAADLVIVSPGGYPKDINLYQAQKALSNAAHAVKPGGEILLLAACPEGFGSGPFEAWADAAQSPRDLTERLKREFVLGGHKAAAFARILEEAGIHVVSEMTEKELGRLFLEKAKDPGSHIEARLGSRPDLKIYVMPSGGSVLPKRE